MARVVSERPREEKAYLMDFLTCHMLKTIRVSQALASVWTNKSKATFSLWATLAWKITPFCGSKSCSIYRDLENYRVIRNDCQGFNNLSFTVHLREQYVVAPMDQKILEVFFYDVRCAVVMYFSAWSAVH